MFTQYEKINIMILLFVKIIKAGKFGDEKITYRNKTITEFHTPTSCHFLNIVSKIFTLIGGRLTAHAVLMELC